MIYKNYKITDKPNEYGYYEATHLNDCDAPMIFNKKIDIIKIEIDELYLEL